MSMTVPTPATGDGDPRVCPYCGGTIQEAAILCRHCKRRLEQGPAGSEAGPISTGVPDVVTVMIDFLVERRIAARAALTESLSGAAPADAWVALGLCQAAGFVAPAQLESLGEAFRKQQIDACTAILAQAVQRGWLSDVVTSAAVNSFESRVFQATPQAFLSAHGILTPRQADELGATGRAWRVPAWTRRRSAVVVLCALCFGALVLFIALNATGGEPIRPDCTMTGNGQGSCAFTNTGQSSSDSACGKILVTCRYASGEVHTRSSTSFCSGEVEDAETKTVPFTVAEMDRIGPSRGDWRDVCSFEWIPAHE